ncbi:MAG: ABC transporter ATP-binding protein [Candidatus Heimdallarchaeota archaeon]|nr:MAG: ABC transporter ATP-binding protein [Candidatus Heimdallarchaeota archaeon]
MEDIIEVTNLYKTFEIPRGDDIEVLKGITLKVKPGEFVAIMGPSGSGKSTLLNILSSIEDITMGTVLIDGEDLSTVNLVETRRHKSSIIYQDFNLLDYLTALENVMFPMMLTGISEKKAKEKAQELLERVQLAHRSEHIPDDLSGGEKQRVAIARALANDPKILLADEPTGNLDTQTGDTIIELFREIITEKKITVIIVTHDIQVAKQTDRILILREGTLHREDEILEEL